MKKLLSLLAALVLALASLPLSAALAGGGIPNEVLKYFDDARFRNYTITAHAADKDECFVVLHGPDGSNALYGFRSQKGAWKYWMHNNRALPQKVNDLELSLTDVFENPSTGRTDLWHKTLHVTRRSGSGANVFHMCFTSINKVWNMVYVMNRDKGFAARVEPGTLTYYGGKDLRSRQGSAEGEIQRGIKYFSLAVFPASLSAARDKLAAPPEIPESAQLVPQEVNFTGGKKYPVYSAPGKDSVRSGNGKAAVSTNGWIQVFGREGAYILIQYSISSDKMRFGYIEAKSLPKNADVDDLELDYIPVCTTKNAVLTDDPLNSESPLAVLPAGTELIQLAKMGKWAYVETVSGEWARGFVKLNCLEDSGSDEG